MAKNQALRALERRLKMGDATIIGVGQGRQTPQEARPKQADLFASVNLYGRPHFISPTVDTDGERGIIIVPRLQSAIAAAMLGRRYGQRSVMQGKEEISTETSSPIAKYRVETVDTAPPNGFYTFIEREGLYYQLVPVSPHLRSGRPVRGYAARRRKRGEE